MLILTSIALQAQCRSTEHHHNSPATLMYDNGGGKQCENHKNSDMELYKKTFCKKILQGLLGDQASP